MLSSMNKPFLSTRNICQDPLELFFGKLRQLFKFSDAYVFANNFANICSASLVSAPITGNCEEDGFNEKVHETLSHVNMVSQIKDNNNIYV